ncbi:uncharacterized protein M6B38_180630 [Iris pallida]|uniref:Uncharacterized protein n=1 Tax=Iris pallida TaxID=29817 RepID=A0AAX6EMT9_IRIPA|nr:uncharacterized protein M6B38_180630 [Iris pallida]
MGACLSTSSTAARSRKCSLRSLKHCGKVSAAVSDAPKPRITNCGNHIALREVRVETDPTNRRKSEVSNLTVHLTQLQWHHVQMDASGTCQDEAWYDSQSVLGSDSDDDYNSLHGDSFPTVSNTIGVQMLQCENASCFVDAMCNFEEIGDSMPIALAVGQFLRKDDGKLENLLHKRECREADIFSTISLQSSEGTEIRSKTKIVSKDSLFKDLEGASHGQEENAHETTLKPLTSCRAHSLAPSVSFNDKLQHAPGASPPCPRRTSAVIRLSFKKRSCDVDESTETCTSRSFLYRPRAGLSIPCSKGEKLTQGCWSVLEPSTFNLRGESYFRGQEESICAKLFPIYSNWRGSIYLSPQSTSYCSAH